MVGGTGPESLKGHKMTASSATARYDRFGKSGLGHVSTKSGVLDAPHGFGTRFDGKPGTNPEEMVAAAHAACFTMATSFQLASAGHEVGTLETTCQITLEKDGARFAVTLSDLTLYGKVRDIGQAEFEELAHIKKEGCPVPKLLNCEITLSVEFERG